MGPMTCNSINLLLTITYTTLFVAAYCGVVTDLGNTPVRPAPAVTVLKTAETDKNLEVITVQVEEPTLNSEPILDSTYRIPRCSPSPPR